VFEISDETFERDVLQANVPVAVAPRAPWCGPCRAIHPILEQLEADHGGQLAFGKLNVDENPVIASRYDVLSIPRVLLFEGGVLKETVIGARPRGHFERALAPWLTTPAG